MLPLNEYIFTEAEITLTVIELLKFWKKILVNSWNKHMCWESWAWNELTGEPTTRECQRNTVHANGGDHP